METSAKKMQVLYHILDLRTYQHLVYLAYDVARNYDRFFKIDPQKDVRISAILSHTDKICDFVEKHKELSDYIGSNSVFFFNDYAVEALPKGDYEDAKNAHEFFKNEYLKICEQIDHLIEKYEIAYERDTMQASTHN